MKLYEIANDYLALMQAIEEGDLPEEAVRDTLEAITSSLEDKADNIACLLKTLAAEIQAFRGEEVRLAERRRSKEKAFERLLSYLSDTLQRSNIDKVETARNRITFLKSEAVEITDEAAFMNWANNCNDDLLTYSAPTPNKTAIKKAIKDGDEVVGAELRVKQNIQIR